jgi:hypothetical protein
MPAGPGYTAASTVTLDKCTFHPPFPSDAPSISWLSIWLLVYSHCIFGQVLVRDCPLLPYIKF